MMKHGSSVCKSHAVRLMLAFALMVVLAAPVMAIESILPEETRKVPFIYCSDIFHPAMDVDDHFDMAVLFALKDFDVKAVILDGHILDRKGQDQFNGGGDVPLKQMCALSGYQVPSAIGLKLKLKDPLDRALDADPRSLAGVELMAKVLRESPVPVTIKISSGTDLAVLFNRDPELCRKKIRAVYFNAGHGAGGASNEYNVRLDPVAFTRIFETGLNLYWNPCFGTKWTVGDGHCNYFRVKDQREMLTRSSVKLNRFFSYALLCPKDDPMEWMEKGPPAAVKPQPRNMWTPPVLAHAAGREVYRLPNGDDLWMTPKAAAKAGLANRKVTAYGYDRAKVNVVPEGRESGTLEVEYGAPDSNVNVFRQVSPPDFGRSMLSCLRVLYGEL